MAEDVLGMFDKILSSPRHEVAPARPTTEIGRDRPVAITLTADGQLTCVIDTQWLASQYGSSDINQALSVALAAASKQLQGRQEGIAWVTERLARLSVEIQAEFSETIRFPTKGRGQP